MREMTIKNFRMRMLITVMAVVAIILATACDGSAPEVVEIPVRVTGETMDPGTIRVKQGDMVHGFPGRTCWSHRSGPGAGREYPPEPPIL